ncbi:MAG: CotH kinase family protein [Clostridia bacterium]|nr:CotH kinase family protein [Clostridia bacterium]
MSDIAMKKLFLLLISLLLLSALVLSGCTSTAKTTEQPAPSSPSSEPTPSLDQPTSESSSTPAEPAAPIDFDQNQLTLKAGEKAKLTVIGEGSDEQISFLVDDPLTAHVSQDGTVTAFADGTVTVRARTAAGSEARCTVTVSGKAEDPYDKLKRHADDEMWYTYCYSTGIMLNKNNEPVFCPYVWYRDLDINESNHEGYAIYLRFSALPEDGDEPTHTFPTIKLTPQPLTENDYLELVLQSEGFDSGFCPTVDTAYQVEMAICAAQSGKVIAYGTYETGKTPNVVQFCHYYNPTPSPGSFKPVSGQTSIKYTPGTGGRIEGNTIQMLYDNESGTEVRAVAEEGYEFLMWSDGKTETVRSDTTSKKGLKLSAYFLKDPDENSPVADMYLFTDTGEPVLTKKYQTGTLMIRGSGSDETDITVTTQVKGRGNSSWNAEAELNDYDSKNSYRLKLDKKEQLLGIGDSKNRDWVLNSNKFDLSALRNYLVWELANRMGNFSYVPECSWVQLYVNGQYRGLYMVTELVEIANDRVEIDDTIDSTDKGYFLEVDFRGSTEGLPFFYVEGYGAASNGNAREFVVKSECTAEDKLYIQKYIQSCHDAMVKGDRAEIDALIDIPSLIDMYIIEELSKDVDVGAASCYLQKSAGGKLEFTAPWDFDFGFGTFEKAVKYENMISIRGSGCTWFSALLEQEWFRKEVIDRMNELEGSFEETIAALESKATELKPAADENALFWEMYGKRYHPYVDKQVSSELNSYEEHIDFLKTWTINRWQYMKEFIAAYGTETD